MLIQVIAAFFATIFFSIMFNTSKSELIYCGLIGALGWLTYLISLELELSIVSASFFGALVVSTFSQILARLRKNPVTLFQVAGIIPLVPGAGMYHTLSAIVRGEYTLANEMGSITLQVAGSIALAMILVTSINTFTLNFGHSKTPLN